MKRNNKGFTLVELLAALVILGVLALFALPTVINLLSDSRNKLYITDAKKLISQAEYKFRGASSEIEKPDSGECLVLSMVYLDNSDFDNAPNNGKYLREASYVVVKNNNGNYEFSAELVEEISKNVYKGVELTRDSNLKTSSTRHVVSFTKDDLNFVESNTVMGSYNGKQLDSDYINSKLGNSYIEGISKVYNYPDLADSTYNANYAIPRIARAEYVSASNKNFNSLDAILKIVAVDSDTKTKDLEVIIGPASAGRYPDLDAPLSDVNTPYDFTPRRYSYGMLSDFSLEMDFSAINLDYTGVTTSLYIVVVDPEGNTDRINPTYTIHTNEAPVIDLSKSGVFKRHTDNDNLSSAILRLVATDDITSAGDLEYCITEDKDATSCSNYKKYSEFVNYEKDYTFTCGGQCDYDGRTLYLKVFLRDNDNKSRLETSALFSYQLFKNNPPRITSVTFNPEKLPFLGEQQNYRALKTGVSVKIEDASSENNITVKLDESENFDKNPISLKYSDFSGDVAYTFSGYYDGSFKKLYVRAVDEYGAFTTYEADYGNVYLNKEPEIKNVSFKSLDILQYVCPNTKLCDKYGDNGGAYLYDVTVDAFDDLVEDDKMLICISETASDCADKNSPDFRPYNVGKTKSIGMPSSSNFKGQERTVYVVLYDDYASDINGNSTLAKYYSTTAKYKIYQNQPPEINDNEISIVSDNIDYNFRDVKVSFKAVDDLDKVNKLKYKLTDGINTVSGNLTATSGDQANVVSFSFGGEYDGEDRELTIEVIDSYGETSSVTRKYAIHKNEAQHISFVTVESVEAPCDKESCVGGNGLKTNVRLNVKDDLDSNIDNLNVCLRVGSGSCTNYVALKNYPGVQKDTNGDYILPYNITLSDTLPYKGTNLQIYAYVKDSSGEVGNRSGSYTLYNNTSASIDGEYPIVKSSNNDEFLTLSTVKFQIKAIDEFVSSSNLKFNVCYLEIPKNANGEYDDDAVSNFFETITTDDLKEASCINNNGLYNYNSDANGVATVDVQLPVDSDEPYTGQKFALFAKVYDDYAQACYNDSSACNGQEDYVSISSVAFYDVYKDVPPTINKFTVNRPTGVTSYQKLNVEFNVTDLLDTYQYCISEDGIYEVEGMTNEQLQAAYATKCTNYSSSYSGDDTNDITLDYNTSWSSLNNDRTYLIYLYIKDSYGNITASSAFPDRVPCSSTENAAGEFVDSGQVQDEVTYELKSGHSELTAQICNYKCYYWEEYESNGVRVPASEETINIKSYYKKTITFLDKEDNSVLCAKEVTDNYEVHCNFRTCFKNASGGYSVPVIGYMVHENTENFSHVHDGETHIPEKIRYEYTSEYDSKTDHIKLTPTGNFICDDCYNEGLYDKTVVAYDNNEE